MRAMVIQDTDGSVEYQKVRLEPSAWHVLQYSTLQIFVLIYLRAVYAKNKAESGVDKTRTAEWYSWEISRLSKMNAILEVLKTVGRLHPGALILIMS